MAQAPGPLVPVSIPWVDPDGKPSLTFRLYFLTLDAVVRGLVKMISGNFANAVPLISVHPPTNANAATAGVAKGQLYTDSTVDPSVVYIRTV